MLSLVATKLNLMQPVFFASCNKLLRVRFVFQVLEYIFGWSLAKENGLVSLCDTLLNMLEDSEQTEEKKMSSGKEFGA